MVGLLNLIALLGDKKIQHFSKGDATAILPFYIKRSGISFYTIATYWSNQTEIDCYFLFQFTNKVILLTYKDDTKTVYLPSQTYAIQKDYYGLFEIFIENLKMNYSELLCKTE